MSDRPRFGDVRDAVAATGMAARGGFVVDVDDDELVASGARSVVIVGNVGGAMWSHFRRDEQPGTDPLDRWTRDRLVPLAQRWGAVFVHPSDEPFLPFQRWAQRAEAVWPSPLGLLIHRQHGLWHAYRGAFLFPYLIAELPAVEAATSPCVECADQPCLHACPVDAVVPGDYDADKCRAHVRSGADPCCMDLGCAARLACPVGVDSRYGEDQMRFHMRAFVGQRA